ncbi:MAG: hypothetical protein K0Q83_1290 [Deltaproteobacteria bacterium]|nr:hypothetical protein [Deltaproteobacteria bacterium]
MPRARGKRNEDFVLAGALQMVTLVWRKAQSIPAMLYRPIPAPPRAAPLLESKQLAGLDRRATHFFYREPSSESAIYGNCFQMQDAGN